MCKYTVYLYLHKQSKIQLEWCSLIQGDFVAKEDSLAVKLTQGHRLDKMAKYISHLNRGLVCLGRYLER